MKDLEKDPKTAQKSISYKGVAAVLLTKKGRKQRHSRNVSPLFKISSQFPEELPTSSHFIHVYSLSDILYKLMGRFSKKEAHEKKFGSDLVTIDCSANNQLPDLDISIGDVTKKASAQLMLEHCIKSILLGIHTFYSKSVT